MNQKFQWLDDFPVKLAAPEVASFGEYRKHFQYTFRRRSASYGGTRRSEGWNVLADLFQGLEKKR